MLVAVTTLALATCGRRETRPHPLLPVVRGVDVLRPLGTPVLVRGEDLVIGHETRRTIYQAANTVGLMALDPDGRTYRTTFVPEVARSWASAYIVQRAKVGTSNLKLPPVAVDLASGIATVPAPPPAPPPPAITIEIFGRPSGRTTSVVTSRFAVPPDGELRFDAGVQAAGARARLDVPLRVSVLDGRRGRPIWRATLPATEEQWRPERVSLAAFAGRSVRLRFATHRKPSASDGVLGVFGEPIVLAPAPRPVLPTNVVLISMDTLRARSVAAFGSERPTSPTLDAFAAEGATFENAFSPAAFTLPGHLSMLTGLWMRTHRAITMFSSLSPAHRTLAESMQSSGYATAAFTSGAWIMPWIGFRRGFDVYGEMPPGTYGEDVVGGTPYDAFTWGLDWLRANAGRPCFLFLHNYVVHGPYKPPRPYSALFGPLPSYAPDTERWRLAYEQEVRYADDQVRAFLEGLAALGLAERTLVVVTADHGEQFGEHGGLEHTYDVHDEVAHVPLVMRLPGAIPPGRRIVEPVSLADIVPTILDLTGLPPAEAVDGTSLLPLLDGTRPTLPRDGVFTEAESQPDVGWTDLAAIRTRTHACTHRGGADTWECYDRRIDPWEAASPLTDPPSDVRAMLARFEASAPPTGAPVAVETPPGAASDGPTNAAPAPDVGDERREQLKSLGYVE
jgi:arylsulfatase A-like enzyme